jgi:hypothetical protein
LSFDKDFAIIYLVKVNENNITNGFKLTKTDAISFRRSEHFKEVNDIHFPQFPEYQTDIKLPVIKLGSLGELRLIIGS